MQFFERKLLHRHTARCTISVSVISQCKADLRADETEISSALWANHISFGKYFTFLLTSEKCGFCRRTRWTKHFNASRDEILTCESLQRTQPFSHLSSDLFNRFSQSSDKQHYEIDDW